MSATLAGKRIVVGVTGSIAAFKVVGWVSSLAKEEARVSVIMTDSAQKFIAPLSFAALTGESPYASMFEDIHKSSMAHIELAQEADLFLIAPATAQTSARLANGMADDLLSTTVLATRAPVIICPAMNTQMYLHRVTQNNILRLRDLGYKVIDPDSGLMACKDEGPGRLVEWDSVNEVMIQALTSNTLEGKRVLVTAGPTRETIDPARFISNRSSGKMGYALAREAFRRGGEVTLVSGPTALECPHGVKCVKVTSAQEMYNEVIKECDRYDIIIKSAAVSDFKPKEVSRTKIKKDRADLTISLETNPDILKEIGNKRNESQIIIGFAAESENLVAEALRKLEKKNLDLVVVNDIGQKNSGFEVDTNKVILVDEKGTVELPLTSKLQTADLIWEHICQKLIPQKNLLRQ